MPLHPAPLKTACQGSAILPAAGHPRDRPQIVQGLEAAVGEIWTDE